MKGRVRRTKSPYLSAPDRLADVIAAIQAAATYKFYKVTFEGWADRISGDKASAHHWKQVLEQHPEFFRLDSAREKASLVWRRQHQKLYDVDAQATITRADYEQLDEHGKARVSRQPLSIDEIATLISTAINLHSRALEHRRDLRWWIPLLVSLLAFLGSLLGALVGRAG